MRFLKMLEKLKKIKLKKIDLQGMLNLQPPLLKK